MNDRINYTLHLADSSLILGHRNSEWTGHGPILEQDIAISNIALDLIGQARNFYQYAAKLINGAAAHHFDDSSFLPATEDSLAYLRDASEFKNILLIEQPNGDWAKTILRQFFFSAYQFCLYSILQNSEDESLAAIAEKSLKEVIYHLRWSGEWVIRLGDGTEESHRRAEKAIDDLWTYTGEMFEASPFERTAVNDRYGVDVLSIKNDWVNKVENVFREATLAVPSRRQVHLGGKEGNHTEHLKNILTEMQFMQRTYPKSVW